MIISGDFDFFLEFGEAVDSKRALSSSDAIKNY